MASPRAAVTQSLLEEKRRRQPAYLAAAPDSQPCRSGLLKSCEIGIARRSGCAVRGVYFGTDCLAGEHVHRVWPDERGGLHARAIGAGSADGDRLEDPAAVSQGVRPVGGFFRQPQPLPGTDPICYVAASRNPGQVRVFEFSLKWWQQGGHDDFFQE